MVQKLRPRENLPRINLCGQKKLHPRWIPHSIPDGYAFQPAQGAVVAVTLDDMASSAPGDLSSAADESPQQQTNLVSTAQ
jgi:hypothetical protein